MNSLPAHSYELRQVTRHFGGPIKRALTSGTPALDGATATLPGGRVYGLIGRNGAGKTTLLRAMAGHVRVKGKLLVDGQPVWDNPEVLDRIILAGPDVPWPTEVKVKKLLSVAAVDAQLGRLGCGPSSLLSDATSAGLRRPPPSHPGSGCGGLWFVSLSRIFARHARGHGRADAPCGLGAGVLALTGHDIHSTQAQLDEARGNEMHVSEVTGND